VFRRATLAAGLVAAAFLGGLIGAACSDNDTEAQDADQQVLNVATAVRMMDEAGFHDTEDSIAAGEIPGDAGSTALKMQAVIIATDWPGDLEDQADELAQVMAEAAVAYDAGDAAAALPHAEAVHDVEHEFSSAAWSWIGEQTGVDGLAHEEEGE
jgi:hypothetical protein